MKMSCQYLRLMLLGLAGLHPASGHYGFPHLLYDGVISKRWEYVRPTRSFNPDTNYEGPSAMCGDGGTLPLSPVKTLKVAAGDTVGFVVGAPHGGNEHQFFDDWYGSGWPIFHEGPATAWLSKASKDDLDSYRGDHDWFKIDVIGASDGMDWDIGPGRKGGSPVMMNFTIPKATPPGKYLLRGEHLNMLNGARFGRTEMYVNCAHIEITGTGTAPDSVVTGTPGPTTRFPAFAAMDPGIWLPAILYRPYKPMDELKNWQGAGPKVWRG